MHPSQRRQSQASPVCLHTFRNSEPVWLRHCTVVFKEWRCARTLETQTRCAHEIARRALPWVQAGPLQTIFIDGKKKKDLFEILQLKKLFGGSCTSRHKTDVFHCSFTDKMFSVIRNFLFCQDFHLLGPTLGTFSVLVGLAKLWYCGRKMVWGRQRKKCWNWVDCKSLMSKLTKATTGFGNILLRTLIPWRIILYQPETLKATAKCLLASAPALKLLIWGTWVCAQFLCCGFQEKNSVTAFQLLLQGLG